jgi:hypothetical protein
MTFERLNILTAWFLHLNESCLQSRVEYQGSFILRHLYTFMDFSLKTPMKVSRITEGQTWHEN